MHFQRVLKAVDHKVFVIEDNSKQGPHDISGNHTDNKLDMNIFL